MFLNKNKGYDKSRKAYPFLLSVFVWTLMLSFQSNTKLFAQEKRVLAEEKVFMYVEQAPEFPGGMPALSNYLATNIHYPDSARNANITGRVVVNFVVDLDGSVRNVKVTKGLPGGCSEEAVRVVAAMPKWKPGKQNGVPVNVYYTLPISFVLKDK